MRLGSLFSGIGGLEAGLVRGLGDATVVWQVELDAWCRRVLEKHYPNAKRFDDVRRVGADELEPVDLICGGFPCQDVSSAGTRLGLQGPRSSLWSEFARIIAVLRPRFVVVENVAALRWRGLGRVLSDLATRGYDAAWDCIPASAVGAPHRRDRLFLCAWRVADAGGPRLQGTEPEPTQGDGSPDPGAVLADTDEWRREAQRIAGRQSRDGRAPGYHAHGHDLPLWPPYPDDVLAWGRVPVAAQPVICRVDVRAPRGSDRRRLRALGNSVVSDCAEVVGALIRRAA